MTDEGRCIVPDCNDWAQASGLCPDHSAAERVALGDIEVRYDQDFYDYMGPKPRPPIRVRSYTPPGSITKYGMKALMGLREEAMYAPDGRNVKLTRIGFRVGQLIARGDLNWRDGCQFCEELGEDMKLPSREVEYVLYRGEHAGTEGAIERGVRNPRDEV